MIGILDTNADPDEFQYPIPGNDDAIRSVGLLTRIIADAAAEGLIQRHQPTDESADAEPLADWERELLEQGAPVSGAPPDREGRRRRLVAADEDAEAIADAVSRPGRRGIEVDEVERRGSHRHGRRRRDRGCRRGRRGRRRSDGRRRPPRSDR